MINAGNHKMTTFETFVLLFGHRKSGEREFHVCIYKCQDKIHGGMILTASGLLGWSSKRVPKKLDPEKS